MWFVGLKMEEAQSQKPDVSSLPSIQLQGMSKHRSALLFACYSHGPCTCILRRRLFCDSLLHKVTFVPLLLCVVALRHASVQRSWSGIWQPCACSFSESSPLRISCSMSCEISLKSNCSHTQRILQRVALSPPYSCIPTHCPTSGRCSVWCFSFAIVRYPLVFSKPCASFLCVELDRSNVICPSHFLCPLLHVSY